MFTLTLTRAERAEIYDSGRVEGSGYALADVLELFTTYEAGYFFNRRWLTSEELMTFGFLPAHAELYLLFLTGDALKQYSPDLANKLAGLLDWVVSLWQSDGG